MSQSPMSSFQSDEALHAFLDGELDVSHEQLLFNDLAASPALRTEMKDALAIRSAVFQDIKSPPSDAEAALMAGLGFSSPVTGAVAGAATSTAASGAGAGIGMKSILSVLLAGVAGFVIAWLLFKDTTSQTTMQLASTSNSQSAVAGHNQTENQTPAVTPPADTVYSVRYVPVSTSSKNTTVVSAEDGASRARSNAPIVYDENTALADDRAQATVNTDVVTNVSAMQYQSAYSPTATNDLQSSDARPSQYASAPQSNLNATLRFRTLASGLNASDPTPQSVQDAFFANSALALLFPLSDAHEVGIEMGLESFQQVFVGEDAGRTVQYTQTPVLLWVGGTYQFTGPEIDFVKGLAPFVNITAGYADRQGALTRGTLGLNYRPIGPLRFTLGLDASALFYSHQNQSFTSSKWGVSYGLSVDLGRSR